MSRILAVLGGFDFVLMLSLLCLKIRSGHCFGFAAGWVASAFRNRRRSVAVAGAVATAIRNRRHSVQYGSGSDCNQESSPLGTVRER